jgi:hypothetical protein
VIRETLVGLIFCCSTLRAQDSTFVRALRTNRLEFTIIDGKLSGRGADALAREARANQFILVGEDHGIREVPEFVGALFDAARPAGYTHLAIEVGPVSSRMLETMMRSPSAQSDLDAFLGRYTAYSIPFFFWREEAQMLERVVKSMPNKRDVVWGLDQEFAMAPTYLLENLARLAPTDVARSQLTRVATASSAADKAMLTTRNPSAVWMFASADSDVGTLRSAIGARPSAPAREIVEELAASRAIYRRFGSGANYESNQERDDLMKRHFVEAYRAAQARGEAHPKVIIKLGANHVFRGPSMTDSYEIGSFVPEFARSEGGSALNILLVVKRGTYNAFRPFGSVEADKVKPYDLLTSEEYAVFDMKSVLAASSDSTWTLIDLRPVRTKSANGALKGLSPIAKRLLLSFDAVVVAPEGHASVYFR